MTMLQQRLATMNPVDIAGFSKEFHYVILLTANQLFSANPLIKKAVKRSVRKSIKNASKMIFGSSEHDTAINDIATVMLNITGNGETIH